MKRISVERSLAFRFPELASEWDYEKNEGIRPENVLPYSRRVVWWKRKDGTSFQTSIKSRSSNFSKTTGEMKSKEESGKHKSKEEKVLLLKTNSLAVKHPDIASEWDYEKNNGIKPEDVFEKSGISFWFTCANGHSWQSKVINRTVKRSGCPDCLTESKSFAVKHPDLYKELNITKNSRQAIDQVIASSDNEVWWDCPNCGGSYEQTPKKRLAGHRCPPCYPIIPIVPYEKSLAYLFPEVAKEWHPTMNGPLTPKNVTSKSGKMVWWQCGKNPDHVWKSLVHNRTSHHNRCPHCNPRNTKLKERSRRDEFDVMKHLFTLYLKRGFRKTTQNQYAMKAVKGPHTVEVINFNLLYPNNRGFDLKVLYDDTAVLYVEVKHGALKIAALTRTQRELANRLQKTGKGNMYALITVSRPDKKTVTISSLYNPGKYCVGN